MENQSEHNDVPLCKTEHYTFQKFDRTDGGRGPWTELCG